MLRAELQPFVQSLDLYIAETPLAVPFVGPAITSSPNSQEMCHLNRKAHQLFPSYPKYPKSFINYHIYVPDSSSLVPDENRPLVPARQQAIPEMQIATRDVVTFYPFILTFKYFTLF